jgi:hypothetical protein
MKSFVCVRGLTTFSLIDKVVYNISSYWDVTDNICSMTVLVVYRVPPTFELCTSIV